MSSLALPASTYLRSYRAPFSAPTRMAADAVGNVYVTDPTLGQVIERAPSGRVLSRFGGLERPVSVAVDNAGRVYIGDAQSHSVTAFNSSWQPVLQLGQGSGEFQQPADLAVDTATGNLYVADSTAHLIKVYSAAGVFLQSFGGQGSGDGQFNFPVGVFVDAAARQVLVVDQLNYRIQVFDVTGTFLSCFGAQGSAPGQFDMPQAVAADSHGRVYVADSVEGRIEVLDRSGGFVGYVGDFGEARGQLRIPIGMVIDPSNRLFVAAVNNARLEVFGLDTFADPETILPAVVQVEPNPIDRTASAAHIAGYIEVPGYPLDQVDSSSIVANGVSCAAVPIVAGDRDGNGVPDIRVECDRSALLATLPAEGTSTVILSGLLGTKHFEGAAAVQITTCGPGTVCSLGGADPQCNEAVCLATAGCTVQPKPDGAGCEDGNACTINDVCSGGVCVGATLSCDDGNVCTDDSCDPVSGCVHTNNTASCDDKNVCTTNDVCSGGVCGGVPMNCDDGNVCTDDSCDPTSGCVHANNTAPCDDQNACTTSDVCSGGVCTGVPVSCDDGNACTDDTCTPTSGCVHTNSTGPCDDGDPGTVRDVCNGAGKCFGQVVTGNYALLAWPIDSSTHNTVTLAGQNVIHGDVCGEDMRVGQRSQIEGDSIAWASSGWAIAFSRGSRVAGDVVTGGGTLLGISQVTVGGGIDVGGKSSKLAECFAARSRVNTRRAEFVALAPTPGFALGAIHLGPGLTQRIPSQGTLESGQNVVEVDNLNLDSASTLTLVGTAATEAVIVHVSGRMVLGRAAHIAVEGITPEQLIFVTDGPVVLQQQASVAGSIFALGRVRMGRASTISGAVFGTALDVAPSAAVNLHPFVGW